MRISDWSSDVCSSDLIAREDEVEADAALLAERRMMELVRLHEPLRIAASRHPAEIALMDEPVVHQRIDDAVEEDAEPDPRPRLPRRGAHDHRAAEYEHGNAHRGADDGDRKSTRLKSSH